MKIANIVPRLGEGVVFNWTDGKASVFNPVILTDAIRERLELLGLATRLQNSYAGGASKGWSIADCRKAAEEMFAHLQTGEYSYAPVGGIWVEAIARALGQSIEDAAAAWAKLDDKAKAKVRKHPKVAAAKLDIERERLDDSDEGEDLSDLLS